MVSDELMQAAFQYKKTKLWKKVTDTELFAVRLSDGEIAYVCIMGMAGQHCALAVYVGQVGIDSYMRLLNAQSEDVIASLTMLQRQEFFMQQSCLQCILAAPSELSPEEYREVQTFLKAHKIKQNKYESCPQFKKYQPRHIPWNLQSEQEERILSEVLMAAVEMAKILEKITAVEVGFQDVRNHVTQIPLLDRENGKYILKMTQLSQMLPLVYPSPSPSNDIGIAKMRKGKRRGVWECEIVQFPTPVQNYAKEVPAFPIGILAVEDVTGYLLPVSPVMDLEKEADKLLDCLMEAFFTEKLCPKAFHVRDERTCCFLRALCDKLNIALLIKENLPALDDAEEAFMEHFSEGSGQKAEVATLLNEILNFSDEDIQAMPKELRDQLNELVKYGITPDSFSGGANKILQFAKARHREVDKETRKVAQKQEGSKIVSLIPTDQEDLSGQGELGKSVLISVTYETGCYRHLQISTNNTLYDLHKAILKAFAFQDNRAHVFFMDNVVWSDQDAYYADGIEDASKKTINCSLKKLHLSVGLKFKYLFDFGEEWLFQCKVLRYTDEVTKEPLVLKSKGEAPDRYGDWDW